MVLFKRYIVGTRWNRLVLTSTHNLCFEKNKKYIKVVYEGVYFSWICFSYVHLCDHCLLDEILGVFRFLHHTGSQSQSHICLDNLLLFHYYHDNM